jgi:hypothetical protein
MFMENPRTIIKVCSVNLTVARNFLFTLKESKAKKQTRLLALDLTALLANDYPP